MSARKNVKERLTNLKVREVSVVDRPANQRPFLVVKSQGASAMRTDSKLAAVIKKNKAAAEAEEKEKGKEEETTKSAADMRAALEALAAKAEGLAETDEYKAMLAAIEAMEAEESSEENTEGSEGGGEETNKDEEGGVEGGDSGGGDVFKDAPAWARTLRDALAATDSKLGERLAKMESEVADGLEALGNRVTKVAERVKVIEKARGGSNSEGDDGGTKVKKNVEPGSADFWSGTALG